MGLKTWGQLQTLSPFLCVDLDGTLIRTDLLFESWLALVRRNPFVLVRAASWAFRGKAVLKHEIARRIIFKPATLPYRTELIDYLSREKAAGRTLVLATASDSLLAHAVARHLGVFDAVIASDGARNLRGASKRAALEIYCGERGFAYAGNAAEDLAVWKFCREAIFVGSHGRLESKVRGLGIVFYHHVVVKPVRTQDYLKLLRPHQWVKNLIVFVPLVTSHQVLRGPMLAASAWAFIAFSAAASLVYVVNDLCDLEADRSHPRKRFRPLACGAVPIPVAIASIPILAAVSVSAALFLPVGFRWVLASYLILSVSYSVGLKRFLLLDIVCLAFLYTLRLVGGQEATGIEYSLWLMAFAMFLFFSLALVKRYSELRLLKQADGAEVEGRGYNVDDMPAVAMLGIASGMLAVLVLALYVNSNVAGGLYRRPFMLLLICPALLYWIARVWMLSLRGKMNDDPVVFAITDRVSYAVAVLTALILVLAAA